MWNLFGKLEQAHFSSQPFYKMMGCFLPRTGFRLKLGTALTVSLLVQPEAHIAQQNSNSVPLRHTLQGSQPTNAQLIGLLMAVSAY